MESNHHLLHIWKGVLPLYYATLLKVLVLIESYKKMNLFSEMSIRKSIVSRCFTEESEEYEELLAQEAQEAQEDGWKSIEKNWNDALIQHER